MKHTTVSIVLVSASIALVSLTACSAGGDTSQASTFATVTGSAVPVADEITALCSQIMEQKLTLEAAAALADASGYATRVTMLEGAPQPATKDLQMDRMSFVVDGGVVTGCTVG